MEIKRFESTASLAELVEGTDVGKYDYIINCAAISDYLPERHRGKIPSGSDDLSIEFGKNPKIIDLIARKISLEPADGEGEKSAAPTILVGFKAESGVGEGELLKRARKRMMDSRMDMVVANDLRDVGPEESTVFILTTTGAAQQVSGSRAKVAGAIFRSLEKLGEFT